MKQIDLEQLVGDAIVKEAWAIEGLPAKALISGGRLLGRAAITAYLSQQRMTPDPAEGELWVCNRKMVSRGVCSCDECLVAYYDPIRPYTAPAEADVSEDERADRLKKVNQALRDFIQVKQKTFSSRHDQLVYEILREEKDRLTRAKSDERVVSDKLAELLGRVFEHRKGRVSSSYPWYGIVRESKIGVIGQVLLAGPFFTREQAAEQLEARRYHYGKHAVTWEFSGCYSLPWSAFYDEAVAALAAHEATRASADSEVAV